jgi:DNA-binding beta-propeller fold protein YncE
MRTILPLALLLLGPAACAWDLPTPQEPELRAAVAGWPTVIRLPNGFWPEGIAGGRGTTIYVGSIATGGIYRADVRTGAGELLVTGQPGVALAGIKYDARGHRLFAAAGSSAYVYDAATGSLLAHYQLGAFLNDAVILRDAVYFTDSFVPVLYRLPLGPAGALPEPDAVQAIPLDGASDWVADNFNANGIVASPDGQQLLVVNTATGALYLVDAASGATTFVDLGGETLPVGDGMLLIGNRLYVVLGESNAIAVVRLSADFSSGTVERTITSAELRSPSTIARVGDAIYAVNARFDVEPGPDVEYEVVRVAR